jgi:hypothetical protein
VIGHVSSQGSRIVLLLHDETVCLLVRSLCPDSVVL